MYKQFQTILYHDALVEGTSFDRAEVETIVVAVSGVNHCYYRRSCNWPLGRLLRGEQSAK